MTLKKFNTLSESEGIKTIIQLTTINLLNLEQVLKWNLENNINFMRVSSDIIPLATIKDNIVKEVLSDENVDTVLKRINGLRESSNMRLTFHPGQYTIISSPRKDVVSAALKDLEYHDTLANKIGASDMIIHIGGMYEGKRPTLDRFKLEYNNLTSDLKQKLRIENDDVTYHIGDVILLSSETGIPVVLDIHHDRCNKDYNHDIHYYRKYIINTWKGTRIKPKIHISSGKANQYTRSHHEDILDEDILLSSTYAGEDFDVMIESKNKELSVLKYMKYVSLNAANFTN